MGHDIEIGTKGYKGGICFKAFDKDAHKFYCSINADEYDNGVSGNGESGYFEMEDIVQGIEYYTKYKYEDNSILVFLQICKRACEENGHVKIYFH